MTNLSVYISDLIKNKSDQLASVELLPARDEAGNSHWENYNETAVVALQENAPMDIRHEDHEDSKFHTA